MRLGACVAVCLVASPAGAVDRLPHFRKREAYSEARAALVTRGWAPAHDEALTRCPPDDERCRDYPEIDACAEEASGACRFSWIGPQQSVVAIATIGRKPIVVGVSCLANCD